MLGISVLCSSHLKARAIVKTYWIIAHVHILARFSSVIIIDFLQSCSEPTRHIYRSSTMTLKLIVSHICVCMDYLPMALNSTLDVATTTTNCKTWSVYHLQAEAKDRFFFSMDTCLVRGYLRWAQNTASRLSSFDGTFIFGARLTGPFSTLSLEPHLLLPAKDSCYVSTHRDIPLRTNFL
jgi:hypothetical protein